MDSLVLSISTNQYGQNMCILCCCPKRLANQPFIGQVKWTKFSHDENSHCSRLLSFVSKLQLVFSYLHWCLQLKMDAVLFKTKNLLHFGSQVQWYPTKLYSSRQGTYVYCCNTHKILYNITWYHTPNSHLSFQYHLH